MRALRRALERTTGLWKEPLYLLATRRLIPKRLTEMDFIMAICFAVLSGLVLGAFLGVASVLLCMAGKRSDNAVEHESDAAPYPRYYE
jgi:hypothetical protein